MENAVIKSLLKSLGLNLLGGLVGVMPFLFLDKTPAMNWGFALLIIAPLSLLIQLIIALIYIANPQRKAAGQGMLISVGLFLSIGIAVCGPMWV